MAMTKTRFFFLFVFFGLQIVVQHKKNSGLIIYQGTVICLDQSWIPYVGQKIEPRYTPTNWHCGMDDNNPRGMAPWFDCLALFGSTELNSMLWIDDPSLAPFFFHTKYQVS